MIKEKDLEEMRRLTKKYNGIKALSKTTGLSEEEIKGLFCKKYNLGEKE